MFAAFSFMHGDRVAHYYVTANVAVVVCSFGSMLWSISCNGSWRSKDSGTVSCAGVYKMFLNSVRSLLDALRMTPKVRLELHMSSRSISLSHSCAVLSVELQKLDYDICLGVCQCACLLTQPWLPLLSRMNVTHNRTLCSMPHLQMCQKYSLKISRDYTQ